MDMGMGMDMDMDMDMGMDILHPTWQLQIRGREEDSG